jgi:hypothetical protein
MAPCEIQQLLPIVTGARLSIHDFSPTQVWLPICNFQGYLMLIDGLRTTPTPILAPNKRNKKTLRELIGFKGLIKNTMFT